MRAPNGQSCTVEGGIILAVSLAGDTVWRCEDIFKSAVETGNPVRFEFTEVDLRALAGYYPNIDYELVRVRTFLNCVILMHKKMSYEVSTIFRVMGTNSFSCKMVSELPVYD
ncbi:MAG: hypothetical protein RL538_843 [Candidatus Parcubacteria bacterium]|jgi:hypothetical protein